jgi:hypothetical protein
MFRLNVPRMRPVQRRGSGGRSERRSGWRRGVAAPDRAPVFFKFYLYIFVLIYLNFASCATSQQRITTPDGAPAFYFILSYFILF